MPDVALQGALIGGAISLVSGLAATVGTDWLKHRREARNLAYAFHGGVGAILTIVAERQYIAEITAIIREAERGAQIAPLKIRAQRNYTELYNKNIEKIGMLVPQVAERIPMFYMCINSLLEDLDAMYSGEFDDLDQARLLAIYRQFLDLLIKAVNLGNHLLAIIKEKYPTSMLWAALPG